MAGSIRAFQIYYDAGTRGLLDPDFEPLDNTRNARPDWFEYWPMRSFLAVNILEESGFYGFLSPNFFAKTRLSGAQVKRFVDRTEAADIVTFSPHPCHAACFLNVFEQAEFTQPGFMRVMSAYLQATGSGVAAQTTVHHSGNTVFSNFFLAKPEFWRRWAAATQILFGIAESGAGPIGALLNQETPYVRDDGVAKRAQMKVFVMERIATHLLATEPGLTIVNYPPFDIPVAPYFSGLMSELMQLDALKLAYSKSHDPEMLRRYRDLQASTLAAARRSIGAPQ